jgi:MscS family membrane protein
MNFFRRFSLPALVLWCTGLLHAQDSAPAAVNPPAVVPADKPAITSEATDVLERFVNWLHHFMPDIDDTLFHWIACGIVLVLAILLRHVITNVIFHYLKKLAAKTETTLDDKLFPALEAPVAALIMVLGIFAALTVLQLSEHMDKLVNGGATIAVLGVIMWGVIKAGGAILAHMEEIAHERQMTVATFMPLIKKTLFVFGVIVGVLLIADSLGAKIGVFLTSLGIGGLAFALAAQDTIANLFGSFVVVVDQPFKVGDVVKIGASTGTVEDIGLRSTKIRLTDQSLAVMPNKMVSTEAIVNLSRFTSRRVEQVFGLTYDTKPDQMEAIVREIRQLIEREPGVDPATVHVYFRDYSESSLDIWTSYAVKDPDFAKHLALRQRLNLAIMRAVEAQGLAFAYPTQTMHLPEPLVGKITGQKA